MPDTFGDLLARLCDIGVPPQVVIDFNLIEELLDGNVVVVKKNKDDLDTVDVWLPESQWEMVKEDLDL